MFKSRRTRCQLVPQAVYKLLKLTFSISELSVFTALHKASFASAVYVTANSTVRPSVRQTPVLCQNEGTQRNAVFTVG